MIAFHREKLSYKNCRNLQLSIHRLLPSLYAPIIFKFLLKNAIKKIVHFEYLNSLSFFWEKALISEMSRCCAVTAADWHVANFGQYVIIPFSLVQVQMNGGKIKSTSASLRRCAPHTLNTEQSVRYPLYTTPTATWVVSYMNWAYFVRYYRISAK